jgi:hypothetical protein
MLNEEEIKQRHFTRFCMGVKPGLSLREQNRPSVSDNRVLREVLGPTRDEVTGEWRALYSEQLHDLYCSLNIISLGKSRRMRWARHVERMREKTNAQRILVGNPEGKIPVEKPRHI